ncbi:two-component system response regulator CreB [Thaumasiovibrio subtropicus]|uniref:two-component system response regulator CreB n=1 Tax=Thaumasiovibrio subtropicus TaxID=1891207 RepID=UPI000B34EA8E|nr:two-component system response regulator CreB [Thaumasiovibrio subtropicus]
MQILIVEDEQSIADNIVYALKLDGFSPTHCLLGEAAIAMLKSTPMDLVILDVGLPDMNGFEVCKAIREFSDVPIIFLTARDHEIDRVVGLEIGGDDYVTKPFSPRELVARVKVILKRVHKPIIDKTLGHPVPHINTQSQPPANTSLFLSDDAKKQIHYQGTLLNLTRYEYGLLKTLLSQPERVFSREQLMTAVWSDNCGSFDRAVDTHIKGLRAKLKQIEPDFDPIKTHRGLGYSLSITHD